jgi:hypothetical protein
MVAELIPAVRNRFETARPARAAAAPLLVLRLISLLGDDVKPGWATRMRTATHERVVGRKVLGEGCSSPRHGNAMRYRRFGSEALIYRSLTWYPSRPVVSNRDVSENRHRLS